MLKICVLLLFTVLTSCDLIDYHPYDGRISEDEDKDINNTKLLQKSEMQKDIVIELSYKGFS